MRWHLAAPPPRKVLQSWHFALQNFSLLHSLKVSDANFEFLFFSSLEQLLSFSLSELSHWFWVPVPRKKGGPRERKPRSVSPQWDHVNNCVILAKLLRREFMGSTRVSAPRTKRMNSQSRSVTRFQVCISAERGPGTFLGLAMHNAKLTAQSHRLVVLVFASLQE